MKNARDTMSTTPMCHHRYAIASVLLLLGLGVHLGDAHRCYVCGPRDGGFNKTCEHFELHAGDYEQECPAKHFVCSTQYEGTNALRQCEKMPRINDCQTANGVKYCYCATNLCNGASMIVPETDDEDILDDESSGYGAPPSTPLDNNAKDNNNNINVIIQDVGGNAIDETRKADAASDAAHHSSYTAYAALLLVMFLC